VGTIGPAPTGQTNGPDKLGVMSYDIAYARQYARCFQHCIIFDNAEQDEDRLTKWLQ
jgi:hypothetical protein